MKRNTEGGRETERDIEIEIIVVIEVIMVRIWTENLRRNIASRETS